MSPTSTPSALAPPGVSLAEQLRWHCMSAAAAVAPRPDGTVTDVIGLGIGVSGARAAVGELVRFGHRGRAAAGAGRRCAPGVDHLHAAGHPPPGWRPATRCGDRRARCGSRPDTGLLGRVVDTLGRPIDGGPPAHRRRAWCRSRPAAPNPLHRRRVTAALPTGVRAMDTLIPLGAGQRVGIMAGSGVGKSTLLGMAVRGTGRPGPRGRPGRRAWPRGPGVHRGHPGPGPAGPHRGRGRDRGRPAAAAAHRRVHRHPDRRVVPRRRARTSCWWSTR